jgi:isoleucyl-tRNA synthetase
MSLVREIAEAASNARQKAGRKLRWPVSEIVISPTNESVDLCGLDSVLKGQTNSKTITILSPGQKPRMDLELLPVPKQIGPVFKSDAMSVVHAIKSADPFKVKNQLESGEAAVNWEGVDYSINKKMVELKETPPSNLSPAPYTRGMIYVDVALSPELEAEGFAREVIRRIQDMRKELDLRVEDKIKVSLKSDDKRIMGLIEGKKDYIAGEVRAINMKLTKQGDVEGELIKDWIIEDLKFKIGLNKIQIDGA